MAQIIPSPPQRYPSVDGDKKGIHLVNAWAEELGIVLGYVKTREKSDEITAAPELLSVLELKGCVVTIDALSCQKQIAHNIHRNFENLLSGGKDRGI